VQIVCLIFPSSRSDTQCSPREIEEVLHSHACVVEAHVIGVPDDVYGEQVMAWVRMRDGGSDTKAAEASLKEFCRGVLRFAIKLLARNFSDGGIELMFAAKQCLMAAY
jgi:acyl-CoA synthetase (AMP-forming)/AMP-acid ligase II